MEKNAFFGDIIKWAKSISNNAELALYWKDVEHRSQRCQVFFIHYHQYTLGMYHIHRIGLYNKHTCTADNTIAMTHVQCRVATCNIPGRVGHAAKLHPPTLQLIKLALTYNVSIMNPNIINRINGVPTCVHKGFLPPTHPPTCMYIDATTTGAPKTIIILLNIF